MNKLLSLLCFLPLAITCAIVCLPQNNPPPVLLHPDCTVDSCSLPAVTDSLAQENWQFSIPGEGWESVQPNLDDVKVMSQNKDRGCMIVFVKEATTNSYGTYVLGTLRAFVQQGDQVSAAKQVVINDTKFVEVQVNSKYSTVWAWLTVKDKYGYGFSCGGDEQPDAGASLHNMCHDIANTLVIK